MAKFDIVIRYPKETLSDVYISVSHNSKTRYIKTGMSVNKKGMRQIKNGTKSVKYEVSDKFVLRECFDIIDKYNEKANRIKNINQIDCVELISLPALRPTLRAYRSILFFREIYLLR